MHLFRRFLAQRRLAALLCAATLLLKLAVPPGYMVASEHGRAVMELCSGAAPQRMATAMPGMHDGMADHGGAHDHGKAEMPCAFSGLAMAALGSVDPIQLAALIAFVIAIGRTPVAAPAPARRGYLRPPLRGPPRTPSID